MKGPARKEELKKEAVIKKDLKDKKVKAKGILLNSWLNKGELFTCSDEARAACKTRKRKERQESISSLCQERKVIRSNSEERPIPKRHIEQETNIRRVSSSEDFQNARNRVKHRSSIENVPVTCLSQNDTNITLLLDECEKRRSHERFSKPLTLKCKKNYPNRKLKGRTFHKSKYKIDVSTEKPVSEHVHANNAQNHVESSESTDYIERKLANYLQLDTNVDKERTPSPVQTPPSPSFDLSTLHQQVDDSEPLPSCSNRIMTDDIETLPSLSVASTRLLSSPRNSIIATHCIYLDPDVSYTNVSKTLNPVSLRLQNLWKQINALKKKIKKYESDFQSKNGFKPNSCDKLNDDYIKQLYIDVNKLKREHKQLQDTSYLTPSRSSSQIDKSEGPVITLKETLAEIETKLSNKREASKRSADIEEMANDQLMEEKTAVQKALLHLESLYGRPNNKGDRDLVRPLYDRYRTLKRMVCKISVGMVNLIDLETIHEDETINFVVDSAKSSETPTEKTSTMSTITDSDTDVSVNENLHSMTQKELSEQIKITTEEKKVLKRMIKEYELEVQMKTGKMLQKDDKLPVSQLYKNYKKTKAKLRLLDALNSKQT